MIRPLHPEMPEKFPRRHKRRLMRSVPMLPTLLTLGNLYFGFAAMYCCARELEDLGRGISATDTRTLNSDFFEATAPSFLSIGVWMLIAAMICDALDGRVARKTGQASKFGVQLDSLADVVSFGTAPALMMVTMTRRELQQWGAAPMGIDRFGQLALLFAAIYVCCAALRLARFNVETTLEEASHKGFKGLPSPGAAAAVISLVFLHDHLDMRQPVWPTTAAFITTILPAATLIAGLLMVSRLPYTHAVSSLLRRRPFWQLITTLLAIVLVWVYTELFAVALSWAFLVSGPIKYLIMRRQPASSAPLPGSQPQSTSPPRQAEQ